MPASRGQTDASPTGLTSAENRSEPTPQRFALSEGVGGVSVFNRVIDDAVIEPTPGDADADTCGFVVSFAGGDVEDFRVAAWLVPRFADTVATNLSVGENHLVGLGIDDFLNVAVHLPGEVLRITTRDHPSVRIDTEEVRGQVAAYSLALAVAGGHLDNQPRALLLRETVEGVVEQKMVPRKLITFGSDPVCEINQTRLGVVELLPQHRGLLEQMQFFLPSLQFVLQSHRRSSLRADGSDSSCRRY